MILHNISLPVSYFVDMHAGCLTGYPAFILTDMLQAGYQYINLCIPKNEGLWKTLFQEQNDHSATFHEVVIYSSGKRYQWKLLDHCCWGYRSSTNAILL
jgi:hypothetical protein